MRRRNKILLQLIPTLLLATGCGGGGGGSSSPNGNGGGGGGANLPPTAVAGPTQNVSIASNVMLDGSLSSDPETQPLTYSWSNVQLPGGSAATLSSTTSVSPSFVADVAGTYEWQLIVNDGNSDSPADTVQITATNLPPVANAGVDQNVTVNDTVTLDGSQSSDPESQPLTYNWSNVQLPAGSTATLNNSAVSAPSYVADVAGDYDWQLIVNDGSINSPADTIQVTASTVPNTRVEEFDGAGSVSNLPGVTTNNASALPLVERVGGRYRAELTDNTNNITLHFNNSQGRLDAWLTRFPFEFIARNIGVGTQADSQVAPAGQADTYIFSGVQVHDTALASPDSSHVVVGHRGNTWFTIEGKNTVSGVSAVDDIGANTAPNGRADIRIVGDTNGDLTVYWQTPNLNHPVTPDSWTLYDGGSNPAGQLPGTQPDYGGNGDPVYVGLITYAFDSSPPNATNGVPFVGTCDSITLIEN